jgi:hypothetical protein
LRLEAIFDGSENGYEENGRTWDRGVVEGEDGAEAYLHSRTDTKERAETKLIREKKLLRVTLAIALLAADSG